MALPPCPVYNFLPGRQRAITTYAQSVMLATFFQLQIRWAKLSRHPIIKVTQIGNIGNRMFQYMFARSLQRRVPLSKVVGFHIPDWDIISMNSDPLPKRSLVVKGGHDFNLDKIAYLLNSGIVDGIDLQIFGQRLEYCGEPDVARGYFAGHLRPALGQGVSDDSILISIRGAEIIGGLHRDYMPIPPVLYEYIIKSTGLKPVFMGQIDNGSYFQELRARFPEAVFKDSTSPVIDFNIICNSKNIICSISSFCWLAAWMSNAAVNIHLPVAGLYNPLQRPDINLLPLGDERYHFYFAKPEHWTGTQEQLHDFLVRAEWATPVSHGEMAEKMRAGQVLTGQ